MARRVWARSIRVAFLASAGVAAGQLGLGYGLGIIAWTSPSGIEPPLTRDAWPAALVWATWITATAVVAGAVAGHRQSVETGRFSRVAWQVVVALASTAGALVAVPLVAIPARHAAIADNYAPHLLAAVHATTGAVIGLVVALFAMASRAGAANVIASAAWAWLLAGVVAIDSLVTGGGMSYSDLGVWEFTQTGPYWGGYHVPSTLLMLGAALLIGAVSAFPAAARRDNRVVIAVSGAAGPVLITAAYLLARPQQANPIAGASTVEIAPYLVFAGLIGSVLVALVGTARRNRRAADGDVPAGAPTTASTPAPTNLAAPTPAPAAAPPARSPALPPASPHTASSHTVSATASVPASSRANPTDHPLA